MMRRRAFWIILLVTTIAWLGVSMSEEGDYSDQVRVAWTGIDTARYAVTYADSLLPVSYKSDCFQAIKRHGIFRRSTFTIAVGGDTTIHVGQSLFDQVGTQLGIPNFTSVYSAQETLHIAVSQRTAKAFHPQLRDVEFHFADQLGLAGEPVLDPDTVWLYGSPASLDKISQLYTAPTVIDHIADSGYYAVPLDPVWKQYPDLRCSHDVVRIYLPVERFAEVTLSVPVTVRNLSQSVNIRLYPSHDDVTAWVPMRDYRRYSADQFQAVVDYDSAASRSTLPVLITRFPSQARVKRVEPQSMQYVIIK